MRDVLSRWVVGVVKDASSGGMEETPAGVGEGESSGTPTGESGEEAGASKDSKGSQEAEDDSEDEVEASDKASATPSKASDSSEQEEKSEPTAGGDGGRDWAGEYAKLEAEKQVLADENAELKAKVAQFEGERKIAAWKAEIAKACGVPEKLLRGSTREELAEHGELLKEALKPRPVLDGAGEQPGSPQRSIALETANRLLGINN